MTRKIKVIIKSASVELEGELFDTPTANKFWEILPVKSSVNTWGEEIYFDIPLDMPLEPDARAIVEIGEIGYWDVGKALAIFFGPTPASRNEKPVAASAVNILGKVLENPKILRNVKDGNEVIIEKFE